MNTTAWYQGLIDDNGLAELRVEKNGEWLSKHHRDTHSLMLDVQQHDDEGFNCYTTINRPKPEEFEDSKPRFLRDADIDVVSRLLIDFDPKRKSSPSTPRQLDHARAAARKVEALLASLRWPDPARAESGNGIHLLYRVRIPNVVEWHPKWQSCLKGLKQIFNFEKVEIDTSVANPAQLTRAYGSVNHKATKPSGEGRCRRSEVFVPANYQCVPWTALQGLVDLAGETLGTQVGHVRLPKPTAPPEAIGEVWAKGITRPSMSSLGSGCWIATSSSVMPTNMQSFALGQINIRVAGRRMRLPAQCSSLTTPIPYFTARTTHALTETCLTSSRHCQTPINSVRKRGGFNDDPTTLSK